MPKSQILPPTTADSERREKNIQHEESWHALGQIHKRGQLPLSKREYVSSPSCFARRYLLVSQLLNLLDCAVKYNSGKSGQIPYVATVSRQHRSQWYYSFTAVYLLEMHIGVI